MKRKNFVYNWWFLAGLLSFFLYPAVTHGAVLYLEPSSGEYRAGDSFIMEARIDTQGECINAVEVDIAFPNDLLALEDFSTGDSILSHWIEKPTTADINRINDEGKMSFSGGIPGGYCGRIAGDPSLTNILGKIIFRIPSLTIGGSKDSSAEIKILSDSRVFLHDGRGTEAKLNVQPAEIFISDKATGTRSQWDEQLAADDIPPEPFVIELKSNPAMFDGQYFIVFWTLDKQTGVDHFEVKEGARDFKPAESPYLLEDQTLNGKIIVKAVDKAGNERLVEYLPEENLVVRLEQSNVSWGVIVMLIELAVVIMIGLSTLSIKNHHHPSEEDGQDG